jgi:hypothetical protein
MRCNQCRQELGLVHHYWGMPFCSTVCMDGYKSRLGEGTRAKIASLVVAKTAEGRSRHWRPNTTRDNLSRRGVSMMAAARKIA